MSKFQFLRSYLLIILTLLLVGWGLDKVLLSSSRHEVDTDMMNLKGTFLYIESSVLKKEDSIRDDWETVILAIEKELSLDVDILHEDDFYMDSEASDPKNSQQMFQFSNQQGQPLFYKRLKQTAYFIEIKGLLLDEGSVSSDFWLIYCYYLLVATALLIWLWPMYRDLQELRQAAIEFGTENFAARVKLSKHSNVGYVADAFNAMAQKIQDLIVSHEELTHAVSHELKTPLARLKFSQEMLSQTLSPTSDQKYLQMIHQDVDELDELIDEMLSYAKLTTQNLRLNQTSINLKLWMADISQTYTTQSKKIEFVVELTDSNVYSKIDSKLMARAVNNLIRNGIRYAEKALKISLKHQEKNFSIVIEDDGPGIPEHLIAHVLKPFARIDDSRSKHSGGYGLGLAIAKKIVEQHSGEITISKSILGGACIVLSWPAL